MTKTHLHAAALALAVATTAGTFAAADALARQQYVVAERVVLAGGGPVATPPPRLAVGHRRAQTAAKGSGLQA
jgi:hypothetical protein